VIIGSAYREHNQNIFAASDCAIAISMLPGKLPSKMIRISIYSVTFLYVISGDNNSDIPADAEEVIHRFPTHSSDSLTKADILLHFRLVGLSCLDLLQHPVPFSKDDSSHILKDNIDRLSQLPCDINDHDGNEIRSSQPRNNDPYTPDEFYPTYNHSENYSDQSPRHESNADCIWDEVSFHKQMLYASSSALGLHQHESCSNELKLSVLLEGKIRLYQTLLLFHS
jgi:hypothetical protein